MPKFSISAKLPPSHSNSGILQTFPLHHHQLSHDIDDLRDTLDLRSSLPIPTLWQIASHGSNPYNFPLDTHIVCARALSGTRHDSSHLF